MTAVLQRLRALIRQTPRNDASTIIGMQSTGALFVAVGTFTAMTAMVLVTATIERPWLFAAALVLIGVSAGTMLYAPGDPIHWPGAVVVTVGPIAALLLGALSLGDRIGMAHAVFTGATAMIFPFLCVRGRVWCAWLGYLLFVAVVLGVDAVAGPYPTLTTPIAANLAVMLMATFFAAIVRPRARQIYALRRQTERESAQRAADQALLDVRDQQRARLEERARPLLIDLAGGGPFPAGTADTCALVEAQLRDRIRAPGLDTEELADAAWGARARGARVVLLDDRGGDLHRDAGPELGPLHRRAVDELGRAGAGREVIVRLLPDGRELLATIAVSVDGRTERVEFGPDGRILVRS